MSVYIDTSIIVPLFISDPLAGRARAFMASRPMDVIISDLASAEFASVVGVRHRTKALTIAEGLAAFANLDTWANRYAATAETLATDVHAARTMLRRLDLALRAPDAIHIAIALRLGAELATFDARMADCARTVGASVIVL